MIPMNTPSRSIFAAFVLSSIPALAEEKWTPLLAGNDFTGWSQKGGKADYAISNGVVTGKSVLNTPNSFMCTDRNYGDFVLEYEFKVDERLNSGVQIRSNSLPEYHKGQVHGYQVEIDPDVKRGRLWSAGIYDEGRRGWLNPLDKPEHEAVRKALKPGDWNKVRVEATGPQLRTWLNDVSAADLVDSLTQTGFIGLQVHGVGAEKSHEGLAVEWRGLRIQDLGHHEWHPLMAGNSLKGFTPTPGGKWEMTGGVLTGTSPASEPKHGILLSEKNYGDFCIRFQFRVTSGNSGFYFRCEPVADAVAVAGFQAEVDDKMDTGGIYETGGRGWVAQVDLAKIGDAKQPIYKPGEWGEMVVTTLGDRYVIHVNGQRTVDIHDPKGRREGRLGFQLHGGMEMKVEYKDLQILLPVKP